MATIKVVLRTRANKDGTYPLALRITKDRKPSFIHLGYHVKKTDWLPIEERVKSSHPNSKRLNNFILKKKSEASDTSIESETIKNEVSSRAIKQKLKPKGGSSFAAQAELYLKRLKLKGYNEYVADKPRVKYFKEFLEGNDIAFSDITPSFLQGFKVHLKATRKIKERTAMNYLVVIRSIFRQAINEGVTEEKYYPFGKKKVSIKNPESTKVGISKEDVRKLEEVELANRAENHARNLWLISFYFAGMRISDVLRLRWSDFQDMRLHYTMGKNNKPGSIKVLEKALRILEKYEHTKKHPDDLIFHDLKGLPDLKDEFEVERKIAFATNRYDKLLRKKVCLAAGILSKVTMHIARHTFASLAGNTVAIQMLQKLYRHTDIRTTIGYQANFIHQDSDDALEKVIGV